MAVAGQLVRERADVVGALHVVLTAQRIDADAGASEVAGRHRQIRHREHRRAALAMLGHAEAVVDGRVRPSCEETRGAANFLRGHAGDFRGRLGRVALLER